MTDTSTPTSTLEAFSICGVKAFWSPGDCANIHREQAYALLTFIADAFRASDGMDGDDPALPAPTSSLRPRIIGEALQGIATLVALSLHATDCADSADTRHMTGSAAQ